jgi:hypothetical protein
VKDSGRRAEPVEAGVGAIRKSWGELKITTQVTGFRKRRWHTHENLGEEPLDLPPSEMQTTGYWLTLSEETIARLRDLGAWSNDPNDYGPGWDKIRERVRGRDKFTCQVCGAVESSRQHDVHHKVPFRAFASRDEANRVENLATLCPSCHHKVEQNVRMRSGLAGLAYALANLAPLFLMCDSADLGTHIEPVENKTFGMRRRRVIRLHPGGDRLQPEIVRTARSTPRPRIGVGRRVRLRGWLPFLRRAWRREWIRRQTRTIKWGHGQNHRH